jgi:hypothetical protein
VDGYSSPRAKKLVLQVSKVGLSYNNARGRVGWECCISFKYCKERSVNIIDFVCRLKNKPCVKFTSIMRLISWIRPRGSETDLLTGRFHTLAMHVPSRALPYWACTRHAHVHPTQYSLLPGSLISIAKADFRSTKSGNYCSVFRAHNIHVPDHGGGRRK